MSDGEILARLDALEARFAGRLDVIENKVTQTLAQATLTNGRVADHDDEIERIREMEAARAAAARRTAALVGVIVGISSTVTSGIILFILTGGSS
jgi:hypothetical protein